MTGAQCQAYTLNIQATMQKLRILGFFILDGILINKEYTIIPIHGNVLHWEGVKLSSTCF